MNLGLAVSSALLGSALAPRLIDLVAWRVIGGVAVGFASVLAPACIAEISPAEMRCPRGLCSNWPLCWEFLLRF